MLPATAGEGVQEGVACGVVGLAGAAEDRRHGREQHKRTQVEAERQVVQVAGRVDLRPQDRVPLGGFQRRQHAVVDHTGDVHHGGQAVGNRADHLGHGVAVGDVGRDRGHRHTRRPQFFDPLGGRAGAGHQHQLGNPVFAGEVCGHVPPEAARCAGHQHRLSIEDGGGRARGHVGTLQPGYEDVAVPDRDMRFVDTCREGGPDHGVREFVALEEGEPAGVLGLRGAHQPRHRGLREVTLVDGDNQVSRRTSGVSEPRLQGGQHPDACRMRPLFDGQRRITAVRGQHDDVGRVIFGQFRAACVVHCGRRRRAGGHPFDLEHAVPAGRRRGTS